MACRPLGPRRRRSDQRPDPSPLLRQPRRCTSRWGRCFGDADRLWTRITASTWYTAGRRLSCCSAVAIRGRSTATLGAPKSWRRKTEMALETLPWDPTEHLKTAEDVREYLE